MMRRSETEILESVYRRSNQIRLRRRVVQAITGVVAAALILTAIPTALRQLAFQEINTADQPKTEEAIGHEARKDGVQTTAGEAVGSGDRLGTGTLPGTGGASKVSRSEGSAAPPRAGDVICDPLITDPKGDVNNTAIDILEASMTYDASRNTLVVREVFDDIPTTPPFPNEALDYEFYFTLDGVEYDAHVYIGPATQGEWSFEVHRDDRARADGLPPKRTVMHATGRVDTQDDTVTIEIDVDEFNRGERAVSKEEGLPPAAELRRGSTLTNVYLISYNGTITPTQSDRAHGCQYVVPES